MHHHHRRVPLGPVYELIERTCSAARSEIADQGLDVAAAQQWIAELEARLDRYEMITEMLLRLCHAKGVATEEEMMGVLRELDLEDGTEDGKWGRGQPAEPVQQEEQSDA
ncbi:MAG: hypothetical protein EPO68_06140 [Planctomycetota bacterium]|nr:MAG: hypothetical protein EPO68_06140 [Planctomycetota bacterium]